MWLCRVIATREGITLRQTFVRVLGKLRIAARNYRHKNPAVRRKARRAERRIRTIARTLLRDLIRKTTSDQRQDHAEVLKAMGVVVRQTAEPGSERMHSLQEPGVVCIAKGKPHKPYEFGSKVSIAIEPATGLVVAAHVVPGRQHDRASVPETLEQVKRLTGQVSKQAFYDLGYRGKTMKGETKNITPASLKGTTGSTRKRLRRLLRRRQVVQATVGRMKSLHRLDRNGLGKELGGKLNTILWLRLLCTRTLQDKIALFWNLGMAQGVHRHGDQVNGNGLRTLNSCLKINAGVIHESLPLNSIKKQIV